MTAERANSIVAPSATLFPRSLSYAEPARTFRYGTLTSGLASFNDTTSYTGVQGVPPETAHRYDFPILNDGRRALLAGAKYDDRFFLGGESRRGF